MPKAPSKFCATINNATYDKVEKVVFNDGGSGFRTGQAQSAQLLVGAEYLDGAGTSNRIRKLAGFIPTSYEVTYQQGGMNQFSMTGLYADENDGATPTDITSPTGGDDSAFHDFQLDIDGVQINKLQSATLSFENLYRFQRGDQRTPIAAVLGNPTASLSVTATWDDPSDQLEYAYGGSGQTSPQDSLNSVGVDATLETNGTTISQYSYADAKPTSHSWNALLDGQSDTTEQVEWHLNNGVSIS